MNVAAELAATAARSGGATALKLDDVELSYRSLDTASARVAALLRTRDAAAGDCVATMLPNVPELAAIYYGTLRAGCVAAPLPVELGEDDSRLRLKALGAKLVFAWHAVAEVAEAAASDVGSECVFVTPREFGQLLATVRPEREVAERAASDAAVMAGDVEWTHGELSDRAAEAGRTLEITRDDVVLVLSSLGRDQRATAVFAATIAAGGCVTLLSAFDPSTARDVIARDAVTVVEGEREQLAMLAKVEGEASPLRVCTGNGVPDAVRSDLERKFGCTVVDGSESPGPKSPRARSDYAGLNLDSVSVRFGGLTALEDVSLHVGSGQVVGVIGPNGAGKTTLFNVICGFLRPDAGTLDWEGRSLAGVRPQQLARRGIARTLQGVGLFRNLTALENVMVAGGHLHRARFATALLGLPRSDRAERRLRAAALEALASLGIEDAAERHAGSLPYPTQKRVALARALVAQPRLLLLDEPAGGLGGDDVASLGELIRGFGEAMTVLVVEHRMDLVMSVCDELVVLDSGRLIARGTPSEVQRDAQVLEAYLGAEGEAARA